MKTTVDEPLCDIVDCDAGALVERARVDNAFVRDATVPARWTRSDSRTGKVREFVQQQSHSDRRKAIQPEDGKLFASLSFN